jgi:hypothetical protein
MNPPITDNRPKKGEEISSPQKPIAQLRASAGLL